MSQIILVLTEWPIQRVLAWLRLKAGEPLGIGHASVEKYAVELEQNGEWKPADEVDNALARLAPDQRGANYSQKCIT